MQGICIMSLLQELGVLVQPSLTDQVMSSYSIVPTTPKTGPLKLSPRWSLKMLALHWPALHEKLQIMAVSSNCHCLDKILSNWATKIFLMKIWSKLSRLGICTVTGDATDTALDWNTSTLTLRTLPLAVESLKFALIWFITEIKKLNGEEYLGKTLYHLVICIQFHLECLGFVFKLINDAAFHDLKFTLDNTMKVRTTQRCWQPLMRIFYGPLAF